MNPKFNHEQFFVRKKVLSVAGAKFHVYDNSGQLINESINETLITIMARSVIDFSAMYDVVDAVTGENLGSLRRKGLKSILKDEWIILNPNELEVGLITTCSQSSRLVSMV